MNFDKVVLYGGYLVLVLLITILREEIIVQRQVIEKTLTLLNAAQPCSDSSRINLTKNEDSVKIVTP